MNLSANTSCSDLPEKRLAWHQVNDQGEECEGWIPAGTMVGLGGTRYCRALKHCSDYKKHKHQHNNCHWWHAPYYKNDRHKNKQAPSNKRESWLVCSALDTAVHCHCPCHYPDYKKHKHWWPASWKNTHTYANTKPYNRIQAGTFWACVDHKNAQNQQHWKSQYSVFPAPVCFIPIIWIFYLAHSNTKKCWGGKI